MKRAAATLLAIVLCATRATAQQPVIMKAVDDATKATTDIGDAANHAIRTSVYLGGVGIDPRSIRTLTSSDVVDVFDRAGRLLGHVTIDNGSIAVTGSFWPTVAGSPSSSRLSTGAAFYDARDRNWTLASGTDSVTIGGTLPAFASTPTVTANAGTNLNTSSLTLDATVTGRLPAGSSPADAESNTNTNLSRIGVFHFVFNGATWDRARGGDANNVASIAGFMNAAPVGRYNATQPTLTDGRWNLFQLSSRGALYVVPGTETFNVTVNAALPSGGNVIGGVTQSGTWTVQPGNTANTTPWLFQIRDAAGNARGANVNASNQLSVSVDNTPTVTANAGTNLNTSALALESGGNLATVATAVRAEDTASADADKGIGALAIRKATPANTSGTDGDYEYLQMSVGRLWTSTVIDTALPTGANVIGALSSNQSVNVAQVNGVASSVNAGASDTGTQRVALSYDGVVTLQASQVSGVANATTSRTTTTGLGPYSDASILINITAGGTATGTLQLFLEDSCDSGTTWNDWIADATFTFGSAVTSRIYYIAGKQPPTAAQGATPAVETLAAQTTRQGPFCDRVRVREKVSGVGGSPVGATYVISGVFKR
jgi:hypothetical protein